MESPLPESIADVAALESLLSDPTDVVIDTLRQLDGDLLVLGVAGKMGPTLARMARRAFDAAGLHGRRVIGVARFSSPDHEAALQAAGVGTIRCDLLDEAAVARLPEAPNVVFMAGRKFGSSGDESLTWAMNTYLPAIICRRFPRSRIVAFSTGNVYGLTPAGWRGSDGHGGSLEQDAPRPVGEYAMSCLGRERLFEHFSRTQRTPVSLVRLNYATEMRYGVLVDLAHRIATGRQVDVTMGYCNVIWQADASAMALASLARAASPPFVFNVAGPEELSVRHTSAALARAMQRAVTFTGEEARDALLSNGSLGWSLFGRPRVDAARLIAWTADWVSRGGSSLDKPTHFDSRDGRF